MGVINKKLAFVKYFFSIPIIDKKIIPTNIKNKNNIIPNNKVICSSNLNLIFYLFSIISKNFFSTLTNL